MGFDGRAPAIGGRRPPGQPQDAIATAGRDVVPIRRVAYDRAISAPARDAIETGAAIMRRMLY
jgi:hypothetical protein